MSCLRVCALIPFLMLCPGLFSQAAASENAQNEILTFSQWKSAEVTRSENNLAKVSNKMVRLRHADPVESGPTGLEGELRSALQAVEAARALSLEHYVAVYLRLELEKDTAKLSQLVGRMTQEEVLALLELLLKGQDADRRILPVGRSRVLENSVRL